MTATVVTFGSVPLRNPSPLDFRIIDDKVFECTFDCSTDDYSDIEALSALAGQIRKSTVYGGYTYIQSTGGTMGDLVISGVDTFTDCYIDGEIEPREVPGTGMRWWTYRVSFAQHTATVA
jgi:hypothetical protein